MLECAFGDDPFQERIPETVVIGQPLPPPAHCRHAAKAFKTEVREYAQNDFVGQRAEHIPGELLYESAHIRVIPTVTRAPYGAERTYS